MHGSDFYVHEEGGLKGVHEMANYFDYSAFKSGTRGSVHKRGNSVD